MHASAIKCNLNRSDALGTFSFFTVDPDFTHLFAIDSNTFEFSFVPTFIYHKNFVRTDKSLGA